MKKIGTLIACLLVTVAVCAQDYTQIYMVGDATPHNWDNSQAIKLAKKNGTDAVFTWAGMLKAGSFKFINYLYTWMPSFNAATADESVVLGEEHRLVFNEGSDEIDHKFILNEGGFYSVTVDMKAMTMVVRRQSADIWVAGDAVPGGSCKLEADPHGNLRYYGRLNRGTLRFQTTSEETADTFYFIPSEEDIDVLDNVSFTATSNADAPGYNVAAPYDMYKLKVNLNESSVSAEKFRIPENLYMIGGATEAAWQAEYAIPFEQDASNPAVFTFNGELKIHEGVVESNLFKILGQYGWDPFSLHPYTAEEPIIGSTRVLPNAGDDKWSIAENQQGRYSITVNVFLETISAEFLGDGGVASVENGADMTVKTIGGAIYVNTSEQASVVRLISTSGAVVAVGGGENPVVFNRGLMKGVYLVSAEVGNSMLVKKVAVR